MLFGCTGMGFVAIHWAHTGRTSPWTSLVPVSATLLILSAVATMLGLVADQVGRLKRSIDELLFAQRDLLRRRPDGR